jgi:predicted Ser/Thr protein kinase
MSTTTSRTFIRPGRSHFVLRALWLFAFSIPFILSVLGFIYRIPYINQSPNNMLFSFRLYYALLDGISFVIVSLLALIIFWRRSDDWMALYLALTIFVFNVGQSQYINFVSDFWSKLVYSLEGVPLFLFCFLFPTGQLVPRFARWFLPVLLPIVLLYHIYLVWLINPETNGIELFTVNIILLSIYALGVAAQIYRFMKISTPIERQQTKWIVFGGTACLVLLSFVYLASPLVYLFFFPVQPELNLGAWMWDALSYGLEAIALTIFPLSVALSISRERLWDIDIVINRSLVGALVTLVLLLIFVPSVFIIQTLLGAENTLLSWLVSAALPAALFQPSRKWVRQFVDRRIYGLNFDLYQLRAAQIKPEIRNTGALTGQRLGQYEVLDFIGKGGMGEVYKGYADGKTVALKTLLGPFALEADSLRRFQREAEVMQKLEHPKIAAFYGAGESNGLPYLAMEFIEGVELKDYLREKGHLGFENAHEILCHIAEALDYLHSQNIVHRDIKPSNVMLRGTEPQEAILMDFGIAKLDDGRTRLTGSNVIGTIDYMAPEQIMAAKEVDKRADVYALGVIAYEMLTGERPFKGSAAQVMFAHLQQPVTDPRQHNANLSESVSSAILKALEKQAEDRYESAGAFAAALAF